MKRLFMLVVLSIISVGSVWASDIGPEAPILGKSTFGINGLAMPEVALPSETSYNPAAVPLALKMFGEKAYAETDYGLLKFDQGPQVTNRWYLIAFQLKNNDALRLAEYTIASDQKPIRYLGPDLQVGFRGKTQEISYGKILSPKTSVGVVLIPNEEITTSLRAFGTSLGQGKAKSDLQFRLGGLYVPSKKLSFGLVYTDDQIQATTTLKPAITALPEDIHLRGDYSERLWTSGVGYQPKEGSILFFSWQKGTIKGPNLSEPIDLKAYGLRQYLNQSLAVQVGVYDKVPGYQISYAKKGWSVNFSFANNTMRRTKDYLGTADLKYIWISKSW